MNVVREPVRKIKKEPVRKIKRETLSEQIVLSIRQFIEEKNLRTGDRLPNEDQMAELFGVSRSSIREATKSLGFFGLIDSAPRRGLTVGSLNLARLSNYLAFHFSISSYPLENLLNARLVIEVGALPFSMERIKADASLGDRLELLIDAMDRDISDLQLFIKHDAEFHRQLVGMSGIEPLVDFTDLLALFFRRFWRQLELASREQGNESHRRLLAALRNQNLHEAEDVLRRHFKRFRDATERHDE
jgi:DNA-binding FadR family transcriptional regulator